MNIQTMYKINLFYIFYVIAFFARSSRSGKVVLRYNDYTFYKQSTNQANESRWRCVGCSRKKCRAFLWVCNDEIMKINDNHSH